MKALTPDKNYYGHNAIIFQSRMSCVLGFTYTTIAALMKRWQLQGIIFVSRTLQESWSYSHSWQWLISNEDMGGEMIGLRGRWDESRMSLTKLRVTNEII